MLCRWWIPLLLVIPLIVSGCRRHSAHQAVPPQPAAADRVSPATTTATSSTAPATAGRRPPATAGLRLAITTLAKDRLQQWRRAIQEVADEAASDPRALIRAADGALADGRTDDAIALYTHASKLDPRNDDALMGLAMAMVSVRQYAQAVGVYRELLVRRPSDATVRFNLAVALSQSGQFEQAQSEYETLLKEHHDAYRARYNLAVLLQATGKVTQAREHYRLLLEGTTQLMPADAAAAWSSYGQLLLDLGEQEQAFEAFTQAAKAQPDDAIAWLNAANAARAVGRFGTAIAACKRAAKLEPDDAKAWARMGEIYLELHRATQHDAHLADAIACWQRSLKLDPNQDDLRKMLAAYKAATQPS